MISIAAVMMSALVDACVVIIAVCLGLIARLGAALAGRVGLSSFLAQKLYY